MQKNVLLPVLALGGGVAGALLRLWQLTSGYDHESQLYSTGHPAVYILPFLAVMLATVLGLLLLGGKKPESFLQAYYCPVFGSMALKSAAALLMIGGGLLGLLDGMRELALWRAAPGTHLLAYPVSMLLCALLSVVSGPCLLLVGRGAYRGEPDRLCPLMAVFPPMAALAWLFSIHLDHSTDPVLMEYGWSMAAAILLMLAHYYAAGFFHGRCRPWRAALCALMGTALELVALADRQAPFRTVLGIAFLLSALADVWALLRARFGPPWPKRLMGRTPPPDGAGLDGAPGGGEQ